MPKPKMKTIRQLFTQIEIVNRYLDDFNYSKEYRLMITFGGEVSRSKSCRTYADFVTFINDVFFPREVALFMDAVLIQTDEYDYAQTFGGLISHDENGPTWTETVNVSLDIRYRG